MTSYIPYHIYPPQTPPLSLDAKLAEMRERHTRDNHKKGTIPYCDEVIAFQALEAVLAIHKKDEWGDCEFCQIYSEAAGTESMRYPCPTVEAIRATIEGR